MIFQLTNRAVSHIEKTQKIGLGVSGAPLDNIGSHGDCRTPHLRCEAKKFFLREMLCLSIYFQRQAISKLERPQLSMITHGDIIA